jgi:hypothetical protein
MVTIEMLPTAPHSIDAPVQARSRSILSGGFAFLQHSPSLSAGTCFFQAFTLECICLFGRNANLADSLFKAIAGASV